MFLPIFSPAAGKISYFLYLFSNRSKKFSWFCILRAAYDAIAIREMVSFMQAPRPFIIDPSFLRAGYDAYTARKLLKYWFAWLPVKKKKNFKGLFYD